MDIELFAAVIQLDTGHLAVADNIVETLAVEDIVGNLQGIEILVENKMDIEQLLVAVGNIAVAILVVSIVVNYLDIELLAVVGILVNLVGIELQLVHRMEVEEVDDDHVVVDAHMEEEVVVHQKEEVVHQKGEVVHQKVEVGVHMEEEVEVLQKVEEVVVLPEVLDSAAFLKKIILKRNLKDTLK